MANVNNDVLVFLDRKEVEFLKNETIAVLTESKEHNFDAEWLVKLAAKLLEYCEKEDAVNTAIENSNLKAIS